MNDYVVLIAQYIDQYALLTDSQYIFGTIPCQDFFCTCSGKTSLTGLNLWALRHPQCALFFTKSTILPMENSSVNQLSKPVL